MFRFVAPILTAKRFSWELGGCAELCGRLRRRSLLEVGRMTQRIKQSAIILGEDRCSTQWRPRPLATSLRGVGVETRSTGEVALAGLALSRSPMD